MCAVVLLCDAHHVPPQAAAAWWRAGSARQVNTQMVVGTLMNLADEPNVVSTGQTWRTQVRQVGQAAGCGAWPLAWVQHSQPAMSGRARAATSAELWWEGAQDRIQRVPIIVTGNDLSTLFAPLVRDGRMAKWAPVAR